MKIPPKDWPVPDEILIEIGRLSLQWNHLENFLILCIGKLMGEKDGGTIMPHILTTHASFPQKLDILASLCDLLKEKYPNLNEAPKAISVIKEAQTLRNNYIHNGMRPHEDGKSAILLKGTFRGKIKTSEQKITKERIFDATRKVDEAFAILYKVILQKDIGTMEERIKNSLEQGGYRNFE